ncbi:MAG: endolytic transglycosylase MltG [Proteobacteria bacterium]|nr:endolytic transglycosylase MltG [Pseudomonadota bacterium]
MARARTFRYFAWLAALAVVAGAVAAYAALRLAEPLPLPHSPYDFEVRPGATLASVARELTFDGVLAHPALLTLYARARRVDRAIKAGSYEIVAGVTLPQLLAKLTQGDVAQTSITITEGTTFADLKRALREHPGVVNTVLDLPDGEIAARLGLDPPAPEGQFFPDTYYFAQHTPDVQLLKRLHAALETRLVRAWNARAADVPLATPYQALVLASIVEKETGTRTDRPLVASVFVNRLRKGMRLQTDPTVIYGLGPAFDGNLRRRDLEADTPYNTYTRDGLPPTPIALPSQASIDAVMHPSPTPYLYFVARGDGTSKFSETLIEHNRAVARYQLGTGKP